MRLVCDFDIIKFRAAAVAEERSIHVVHNRTGDEHTFNTRTEFYGGYKRKDGGWLSKQNFGKMSPMLPEEFTITDVQEKKPFVIAKQSVDGQIENILNTLNTTDYYGYVGKGDSFRVEYSTLLRYKGNRINQLRPLYLEDVAQYLIKQHHASIVTHLECDDKVVMDWYAKEADVVLMMEKDGYGTGVKLFNPDEMGVPIDTSGLGGLYLNVKRDVKGHGRKWKYFQALSQDDSDCYKANCMSEVKWGEKAAFQLLDPCKNDKECLEALVKGFKTLYPEPKVVTGWRGNEIEIDWYYVMNECFNLAHIHRKENDFIDTKQLLDKLKVEYA